MSGGVDSSVAAALLAEAGHEVIGLSMQLYDQRDGESGYGSCCSLDDLHDAGRVARRLNIPALHRQFRARVPADGRRELRRRVRRRAHADSVRALQQRSEVRDAARSLDGLRRGSRRDRTLRAYRHRSGDRTSRACAAASMPAKDQIVFPVLAHAGTAVARELPGRRSVEGRRSATSRAAWVCRSPRSPTARRSASCPMAITRRSSSARPAISTSGGAIVNQSGEVLGRHGGVHRFTVGQRKGLGIAAAEPMYVLQLRPADKTVVVGPRPELERTSADRLAGELDCRLAPGATAARHSADSPPPQPAAGTVLPLDGTRAAIETSTRL